MAPQASAGIEKLNIARASSRVVEPWSPVIVAQLNGQEVKLARMRGEFVWHTHEDADELFVVVEGSFRLELRDRAIDVGNGELVVVPRGVEHRPVADADCIVMVMEPMGTVNTGSSVAG